MIVSNTQLLVEVHARNSASKRKLMSGLFVVLIVLGGEFTEAQKLSPTAWDLKPTTATPTSSQLTEGVLERIQNVEGKMVTVAEDFPDELYNTYRPKGNEDVRTAAEILLHVAALNTRVAFTMRTKEQKDALAAAGKVPNVLHYPYVSKQDTIEKVNESFVAVRKAIQDNPDPGSLGDWLWVIAHSSEHFGNLVAYYRDNGLIPPTSRK